MLKIVLSRNCIFKLFVPVPVPIYTSNPTPNNIKYKEKLYITIVFNTLSNNALLVNKKSNCSDNIEMHIARFCKRKNDDVFISFLIIIKYKLFRIKKIGINKSKFNDDVKHISYPP